MLFLAQNQKLCQDQWISAPVVGLHPAALSKSLRFQSSTYPPAGSAVHSSVRLSFCFMVH